MYSSNYSSAQLQHFAKQLKGGKEIKEAYVFFNNDINTYTVYNASELNKMLFSQQNLADNNLKSLILQTTPANGKRRTHATAS
ncbi:DUF72 domain-containing protein [Pedobacter hartonius]|uniref:DUF72 domain-containing protein n=1 Tax=Pedobacter hartonius TaxID=425514 RepID=UPI0011152775